MLTLPPNVTVLLHREPVDIRRSFDGLVGIVRSVLRADPLTPTFFVFFNRDRNKLKILYWDNDGFAIWYKRLEKGTFCLTLPVTGESSVSLTRAQLAMLLEGIDFHNVKKRKRFKKSA
jgi:transposase